MRSRVFFDAEDINRIVRHRSLAEIDAEVNKAKVLLASEETPEFKLYWKDYLEAHEIARDLAEWCIYNGVPTLQRSSVRHTNDNYRIPQILEAVQEIGNKVKYLLKKEEQKGGKKYQGSYF